MRLLFDQNISRRILTMIGPAYDESGHVAALGLDRASDMAIWTFAQDNGYAIASKDSDFHHLSFLRGAPPKTIWIKLGNCSTAEIAAHLVSNTEIIRRFLEDEEAALFVLES